MVFKAYEGSEELTYLCRVTDKDGCVREFKYLARYSERPYLDEYPNLGKVHPATGYIRVLVNEKEVLNRKLTTDLERIWDIYQSQVLPECRAYIEEKTEGQAHADMQPFFQKLALEVWASEPDYRTGSREDLISSLDALHEDMYFVGSDYFKNYGVRTVDEIFDAPGLILPEIHKREGAPQFRVTLYERQKEEACILCREKEARDGQEVLEKERNRDQISLKISRITCKDGKLLLEIPVKGRQRMLSVPMRSFFRKESFPAARRSAAAMRYTLQGNWAAVMRQPYLRRCRFRSGVLRKSTFMRRN